MLIPPTSVLSGWHLRLLGTAIGRWSRVMHAHVDSMSCHGCVSLVCYHSPDSLTHSLRSLASGEAQPGSGAADESRARGAAHVPFVNALSAVGWDRWTLSRRFFVPPAVSPVMIWAPSGSLWAPVAPDGLAHKVHPLLF